MVFQKKIIREFWWAGRMGHSIYLTISLGFINFILITYNFLIDGNEILENVLSEIWVFSIIFLILYIPVSVLIGRWHSNTQIHVDMELKMFEDPILAKMIRTLLDVQTGKASEEEIKDFRDTILKIEKQENDKCK
jgi:uncharacterized protein YneF (UPF0154 family)